MEKAKAEGVPGHGLRLNDLYREQFPILVRIAFLLCGNDHEAEDAVQEAFLRCVPSLDRLEHPPSYLRAAVVNECRTRNRRRMREPVRNPIPATVALPYEAMETREALALLTERQRTAVVLRYFVDIHDQEIAQILGCRPATVRSLIRRALVTLREELS